MEEGAVDTGLIKPLADVRELRVGIVGTGFIGRVHARAARVAGVRLAGVAASTPERADAARHELGAARGYGSAEELVGSDEIDVVHICTPNHLHVPLARAAIAAGKHVVCEKPVALDSTAAAALIDAAEAAGVVATVPFVYRYYPTVREARVRVQAAAGPPRLIHGAYLQDWLLDVDDYNWRVESELGGPSRAFADIGSHWCDLVEFVSGQRIVSLVARTSIAHDRRRRSSSASFERAAGDGEVRPVDTEDAALILFETDAGAGGSVVVSQVAAGRKNQLRFEVTTDTETFAFDQEHPDSLRVLRRQGAEVIPRDFTTLAPEAAAYVTLPGGHPQGYHDCFDAFAAETYATIVGAAPEGLPRLEDGLRAVRLTEAVLESARQRAWVEVAP
ncbi:MAG TPA: Gfo/Idh/MocA family oxidoreductase [Solirubrobacterales bacterium]|nr:Gfo/Idh/MocA family oxidoreductase [Solirubrobacterales bacterium]